jgi:hypothetical protein
MEEQSINREKTLNVSSSKLSSAKMNLERYTDIDPHILIPVQYE